MTTLHKITLDLTGQEETPQIRVSQGDAYTRQVEITLTEGGSAWTVPEGVHGAVRYRGSDWETEEYVTGVYDTLADGTLAWSAEGNVVTITLVPQMLACPGRVLVDMLLIAGEELLGTGTFWIYVNQVPVNDTSAQRQSYYALTSLAQINAAVEQLNAAVEQIDAALESVREELSQLQDALQAVDRAKVDRTMPILAGDLLMEGHRITGLALPETETDAVPRAYVDWAIQNALEQYAGV